MKFLTTFALLTLCLICTGCATKKSSELTTAEPHLFLGRESAEQILNETLKHQGHNLLNIKDFKVLDSEQVLLATIEPILYRHYGKENISEQQPYEVHEFKNYFVVMGTLPSGQIGGTFELVIDKRNAQILKLSHGK